MNEKQFYDWQTLGGGNDVEKLVAILNQTGAKWCMIGGLAVNHWSREPMATADVDIVIGTDDIERCVAALEAAGFSAQHYQWSVNLTGQSKVTIQISTDPRYRAFPESALTADIHGIRMRIATAADTLAGRVAAYSDPARRGSKRQKDFLDLVRLVEAQPDLANQLPEPLRTQVTSALT